MKRFAEWAKRNGWSFSLSQKELYLPEAVAERYTGIPGEYLDFVRRLVECINPDETVWFITASDFAESDPDKWRYNEFEIISLEAAEGDEEWQEEISAFWNDHMPVVMRVGEDGNAYFALRLSDGAVVFGEEPEFEDTEKVADSFGEFVDMVIDGGVRL